MGIYVFDYRVLVEELSAIVGTRRGFDFGKDVIPGMVGRRALHCFRFDGYWRDVGTIESYLDANRDCLDAGSGLDLASWRVCTNADEIGRGDRPPISVARRGKVANALIARGCRIEGEVVSSVLFPGVHVAAGASVHDAVVMSDSVVGPGSRVTRCILDKQCVVGAEAIVGEGDRRVANRVSPTHLDCGITVLGKQAIVPAGFAVGTNCIVHPGVDLTRSPARQLADGETALP
jgi:glucose-1-phosphate adenylyltransferase